jgi:hypothetical protein
MLTETHPMIPFSVIGQCSPLLTPHWLQGKWQWARNNLLQAASRIVLQNYRQLPIYIFIVKTALGSLKRVTERIIKINK